MLIKGLHHKEPANNTASPLELKKPLEHRIRQTSPIRIRNILMLCAKFQGFCVRGMSCTMSSEKELMGEYILQRIW